MLVAFPSCLHHADQFVVFPSFLVIARSMRTCRCHGKWSFFAFSAFCWRRIHTRSQIRLWILPKNAPLEYLTIFRCAGLVHILGSKIQDHFQTFYQNNTFFFQTQCHQTWSIETLKDSGTKLFWWCAENVQARLSKIWPKRKRFHL